MLNAVLYTSICGHNNKERAIIRYKLASCSVCWVLSSILSSITAYWVLSCVLQSVIQRIECCLVRCNLSPSIRVLSCALPSVTQHVGCIPICHSAYWVLLCIVLSATQHLECCLTVDGCCSQWQQWMGATASGSSEWVLQPVATVRSKQIVHHVAWNPDNTHEAAFICQDGSVHTLAVTQQSEGSLSVHVSTPKHRCNLQK